MENEQKQQALKLIRKLGSISDVCAKMDIDRGMFYRAIDKDPIFNARVKVAKSDFILRSE